MIIKHGYWSPGVSEQLLRQSNQYGSCMFGNDLALSMEHGIEDGAAGCYGRVLLTDKINKFP